MQLSPEEAAAALTDAEQAHSTMRRALMGHRGHLYLLIWGAIWIAMPVLAHWRGDNAARYFPWICLVGMIATVLTALSQARQIKGPVSWRFVGMLGALVVFAAVFPVVLHARLDVKTLYAYMCLVSMQGYVIGGLWFDTYLLWVGLFVTALLLLGIFAFPGLFWIWMAIFGGGTLVATGFYVRHFWR